MANTYTNVDLDEIMNELVLGFQTQYPDIRAFSTHHENGPANPGDTARVQTVALGNAAEAYNGSNGYDMNAYTQDMTTIGVDVALSSRFVGGFYVDDADTSKRRTPAREWADMVHEQIHKKLIDFATTGITLATYDAAVFTGAATTFVLDDLTDIAKALSAARIRPQDRILVLDPSYVIELAGDAGVEDLSKSGDRVPLYEAQVTRLKSMEVIPCHDINANGQNLVGWAGSRKGIQLVSAQLGDRDSVTGVPGVDNGEYVDYVQDIEINGVSSGLGLNVYVWRESKFRRTHYTFEWFGGKALLEDTQLGTQPIHRIVSA